MFLISSYRCLLPNPLKPGREWRCSWSNADRRCSNYIRVINNFIALSGAAFIRGLEVLINCPSASETNLKGMGKIIRRTTESHIRVTAIQSTRNYVCIFPWTWSIVNDMPLCVWDKYHFHTIRKGSVNTSVTRKYIYDILVYIDKKQVYNA